VKKTLCFTGLFASLMLLVGSATAQDSSRFFASAIGRGSVNNAAKNVPGAPKYCSPCLFYGGDWNDADPNWTILVNGDNPSFGGPAAMYTPFTVPAGKTWTVTSIFSNVGFINFNKMDPAKPEWSLNSGVKSGSGGKVIAHGATAGTAKATGRTANSTIGPVTEYTVLVKLRKPVILKSGTKSKNYWESVVPPCTNTNDQNCASAVSFLTDTYNNATTGRGAHAVGKTPKQLNFLNASAFGATFTPINEAFCTSNGTMAFACDWFSAGVAGTSK
jgi:hypothetical protein